MSIVDPAVSALDPGVAVAERNSVVGQDLFEGPDEPFDVGGAGRSRLLLGSELGGGGVDLDHRARHLAGGLPLLVGGPNALVENIRRRAHQLPDAARLIGSL